MARRRKKPKIDLSRRLWSFAFFVAIPVSFFGFFLACEVCFAAVEVKGFPGIDLALFAHGFLFALVLLGGGTLQRLKTFLHEAKHAVVVIATGSKLKEFHSGKEEGYIQYEMTEKTLKFEPFVGLAPYYFPLLSLPVLVACQFLDGNPRYVGIYALSFALAADLVTAYEELARPQIDLAIIWGGFVTTRAFVIGANLCWLGLISIWLLAGTPGYLYAFALLVHHGADFLGIPIQ